MVGRNDPCPSGNKERDENIYGRYEVLVVTNRILNGHYWMMKLKDHRIHHIASYRCKIEALIRFANIAFIPQNQQIPLGHFAQPFRQNRYFDALPYLTLLSPEKQQRDLYHDCSKECLIKHNHDGSNTCNEIIYIREESKSIHSLPGPYTSFAHEMRGEILVQLEKYNQHDEERQEFTARDNGWRVLGWSITRAKELEKIEKLVVSHDRIGIEQRAQPSYEQKELSQAGLPVEIMEHFDQFFMTCVSPLQKRTQAIYGRSMELLYQYLSVRFGQTFRWSMLNEETLIHFLSVWYLDQGNPTPVAAKVFLNTLKKLFYWLSVEKLAEINTSFQQVYLGLIRTLPITIEAKKWLLTNGLHRQGRQNLATTSKMYQLSTSVAGPVILVEEKWVPIKLSGYPRLWSENSFWIRGHVEKQNGQAMLTRIDNVYPVITNEEVLTKMYKSASE